MFSTKSVMPGWSLSPALENSRSMSLKAGPHDLPAVPTTSSREPISATVASRPGVMSLMNEPMPVTNLPKPFWNLELLKPSRMPPMAPVMGPVSTSTESPIMAQALRIARLACGPRVLSSVKKPRTWPSVCMKPSLSLSPLADSAMERMADSSSVSPGQPAAEKAAPMPPMIFTVETPMEPSSRRALPPSRSQISMFAWLLLAQSSNLPMVSENQVPRSGKTLEPAPTIRMMALPRDSQPASAFLVPRMEFLRNISRCARPWLEPTPLARAPRESPHAEAQSGTCSLRSLLVALCSSRIGPAAFFQTLSETTLPSFS